MSNLNDQIRLYEEHGAIFSTRPLEVPPGGRVAVVLLSFGEPRSVEEVESFLLHSRFAGRLSVIGKFVFKLRLRKEKQSWLAGLEAMGGGAAYARIRRDLRFMLDEYLNRGDQHPPKHTFKVYISNSYGDPTHDKVVEKLQHDGIEHVVLLPMYPHFSQSTTGVVLGHFQEAMERAGAAFKIALVHEYARHPQYVQALADRICEGISRFPKHIRQDVQLVFAAFGCATANKSPHDPALMLIQETIAALLEAKGIPNEWNIGCMSEMLSGIKKSGLPGIKQVITELAGHAKPAVLVVPISFITERFEVTYFLDTVLRAYATEKEVSYYEVSYSPQGNPLFLEALGDMVYRKISTPEKVKVVYRPDDWVLRQQNGATIWIQSWVKHKTPVPSLRQVG
ncbi:MAG TPA: ferrochelatase [Rhodothermales bacterium]|nr:ferrochelatase [Rhodothermales bacterium]HRR07161.1 ferrochelatase [Rhodothermales bacterium]